MQRDVREVRDIDQGIDIVADDRVDLFVPFPVRDADPAGRVARGVLLEE